MGRRGKRSGTQPGHKGAFFSTSVLMYSRRFQGDQRVVTYCRRDLAKILSIRLLGACVEYLLNVRGHHEYEKSN